MLLALGAVSSALDALQSLASSKSPSAQTTGFGQATTGSFDLTGSAGVVAALLQVLSDSPAKHQEFAVLTGVERIRRRCTGPTAKSVRLVVVTGAMSVSRTY